MNPRLIDLPKIHDGRGNLTVATIPFPVKRVYYLYDVPEGIERGQHAHKKLERFIIAIAGSFDVTLNKTQTFTLRQKYYGLYIPPMVWSEISNFSSGAVCLVLASEGYDPDDYIRSYDEFIQS